MLKIRSKMDKFCTNSPLYYFLIFDSYPNPSNSFTTISFIITARAYIVLKIYDILGQEIVTLLDGAQQEAGHNDIIWDGKDNSGLQVSSGIYLCRRQSSQNSLLTKKLTFLK